jgi:chemotaxis protein methyltransferase CheR
MSDSSVAPRFDSIELLDREFELLSRLIYDHCGIALGDHKRALMRARLTNRLRKLGFSTFKSYYEYVSDEQNISELQHMLDAISTNLTEFFREPQHFVYMRETFFPRWQNLAVIRILSAGCSSGEEPYSIAISAAEYFGANVERKIQLHAGDLSGRMLARARAGIYTVNRASNLSSEQLHKYFLKGVGASEGLVRVAPEIRRFISFTRLNLTTDLPFTEQFHAIFCRNVAIYFDRHTQSAVFERLASLIVPGGSFFVGHSESLTSQRGTLKYVQPTVYEKC